MAPIPRCDLRLPSEPRGRRSSQPTAQGEDDSATADDTETISGTASASAAGGAPKRTPATAAAATSAAATDQQTTQKAPLHAHRSQTRDSAEILEDADAFSTGLTRDIAEIRDHKLHEEGFTHELDADADTDDVIAGGQNACAILKQCRDEIRSEEAAAAAIDDDDELATSPDTGSAPKIDELATPGDVCAKFCKDRPDSPSSGYNIGKAIGSDAKVKKRGVQTCKGTYASMETYTNLWGSSKAMGARKKVELEMKKKRKYYERLHERNRKRREKEKRSAKEKRKMMRCRDQSKIPETIDNISINKAFYFRFNYNKRLPFMPSAMNQHFKKFKKPPFKHFHKGSQACHKHVDEFEKLRVTAIKTDRAEPPPPPPPPTRARKTKA